MVELLAKIHFYTFVPSQKKNDVLSSKIHKFSNVLKNFTILRDEIGAGR